MWLVTAILISADLEHSKGEEIEITAVYLVVSQYQIPYSIFCILLHLILKTTLEV